MVGQLLSAGWASTPVVEDNNNNNNFLTNNENTEMKMSEEIWSACLKPAKQL